MGAYSGTQNHISDHQANIISQETIWTNVISMIMAFTVVIVYFGIFLCNRRLVDRVTLRLTVASSISDLIYSASMLWGAFITADGLDCQIFMWSFVEFTLLPLFLSIAIATNLCAVYLLGIRQTQRFEAYYYGVPILLSLAISIPLPVFHRFGWLDDAKLCWYAPNGRETLIWLSLTYHLWIILSVIILIVQVAFLIRKLKSDQDINVQSVKPGEKISKTVTTIEKRMDKTVQRVLARVLLYPLVPTVTQSLSIIVYMNAFSSGYWNFGLMFSWCFFAAIQATLNAVVFFFDPAVHNTWKQLKEHLKQTYAQDLSSEDTSEWTRTRRAKLWAVSKIVGPIKATQVGYFSNNSYLQAMSLFIVTKTDIKIPEGVVDTTIQVDEDVMESLSYY
ncbi:hypothetical protein K493DRAFT_335093 [Basidiobolus meristosporus CBS 931.73]|uniref:G-protein coupled receptors family 2 profile 2 domain-containing protein n=1 Tax=Basidiobolus meristosporus CBS 931.73 TaxID=1314790 RepID=A0A1Y1YST1_9FUNG|nr:hypothetical protein K493DRAFT_335093 [Basidiobolus meristosporus CBS 931.73]|eukprot:ORY01088.1 hypothetical protein K493DRAFT_335093 [Basidiobolus meristosporus CBS 931.73]